MNHCREEVIKIRRRGGAWGQAEGKFVLLSVRQLNREISRHYRAMRVRSIGKKLADTKGLAVELNLDANYVVGGRGPNRSIDFEIHGRVAGSVKTNCDRERAFLLNDYLNSHWMYLSSSILQSG